MIKTITIKKQKFTLAATGGMICIYKQQFGREYYEDLEKIATDAKEALLSGYRLIWAMARAADNSIPDPDEWLRGFKEFPLLELVSEAVSLLTAAFSQVKKDEDESAEPAERMTAENLVACCLACGMSIDDINNLSIGFLINSVTEYVRIKSNGREAGAEQPRAKVRKATQADFDAF